MRAGGSARGDRMGGGSSSRSRHRRPPNPEKWRPAPAKADALRTCGTSLAIDAPRLKLSAAPPALSETLPAERPCH